MYTSTNVSAERRNRFTCQVAVDEQRAGQRAADGGPRGHGVVEQIRTPVTDAEGLTLGGARAGEQQLPAVFALAGLDPFDQAAIQQTVGRATKGLSRSGHNVASFCRRASSICATRVSGSVAGAAADVCAGAPSGSGVVLASVV